MTIEPKAWPWKARRMLRRVARRALPLPWLLKPGIRNVIGIGATAGHVLEPVDGFNVEYPLDSVIGQLLFLQGEFEQAEIAFLQERLRRRSGAVVFDVGANIGLHALHAAHLAEVRCVHAFEPGREAGEILQANVRRNACGAKIVVHSVAMGAESGEAEFHVCADLAYSSMHPDGRQPVTATYKVPLVSLDAWVEANAIDRIDFLKLDVEGAEPAVIAGGRRTLARFRPELMVEIYQGDRPDYSASGLIAEISSLGYDAYVFIDGRRVAFAAHDDAHFNYHFVPRGTG